MILLKAMGLSFLLAWWILCAVGNFWFAAKTLRMRRYSDLGKTGNTFYDSMKIVSAFMFTIASILSIYQVYQTWLFVLELK